jgi:hypothetical protein
MMNAQQRWFGYLRGLAGGIAGGVAGYFLFWLVLRHGYYALALPAALLGLACGFASRMSSNLLGAVCAVAGIGLAVYIEWQRRPFIVDESLAYFVTHLQNVQGMSQFMIALSGVFGFWFGRGGREQAAIEQ